MDDRFGKFNMTKMPRALTCFLVTGFTPETRINDAEVQIHQTLRVRKPVIIVCIRPDDLSDTHLADFFWG
jgi:hypothetical protein